MDLALSDEQRLLQESTRRFADSALRPGARAREKAHAIEPATIRALGDQGLLGVNIPAALGGAEAGVIAYAIALREVAAADASVAVTMAVTNMVGEVIVRFGSDTQKNAYVPKLTSGEYFGGAFALSEPGAGSDAGSLSTRAEPHTKNGKPGWLIHGNKMWITTGDQAGVFVVWARTGVAGPKGISCFLVEAGVSGLHVGKPEEKMGLRASHTVSLTFDGVWVPESALLSSLGDGFKIAMTALDGGRIGIASQSTGISSAALAASTRYAKERKQFGKALTDFQAIQFKLADMATELDAGWLLALRAARLKEQGRRFSQEAAMAKVFASEACNRIVREAVQIHGGYGYTEEYEVARYYRDARVTQIYEGTSEIQRVVIARGLLAEVQA